MLIWNEQFVTGVELVDLQHRMLIENINELEMLLKLDNPSRERFDPFLKFMEAYIRTHFACEEDCMQFLKCPFHGQNKSAHAAFIRFFNRFKARYEIEGLNLALLSALHLELCAWITNHILMVDGQLKGYGGVIEQNSTLAGENPPDSEERARVQV